jgi:hypothetical protein
VIVYSPAHMADGQATWFAAWPLLAAVPRSPTKSGCVTSFVVLQSAVPPDPSPEIRTRISGSQAVSRTQPTMRHGSDFFFVSDRRGTVTSMQGPNAGIINTLHMRVLGSVLEGLLFPELSLSCQQCSARGISHSQQGLAGPGAGSSSWEVLE